jgi:hypothetical protein
MPRPHATSAGAADAGAVVSLGGRDSLFPIRLTSHLQRLRCGTRWVLLPAAIEAREPDEPLRILMAVDRTAHELLPAIAGGIRAGCGRIGLSTARITVLTKLPVDNDPASALLSKRIAFVDGHLLSDVALLPAPGLRNPEPWRRSVSKCLCRPVSLRANGFLDRLGGTPTLSPKKQAMLDPIAVRVLSQPAA